MNQKVSELEEYTGIEESDEEDESGNYDYEWEIQDFVNKQKWNMSVLSPSFYSSDKYRFQMQAFTNGDLKDGNLSVYLRLMKGEHDHELKWPYTGKCKISVKSCYGETFSKVVDFTHETAEACHTKRPGYNGNDVFGYSVFLNYTQVDRYLWYGGAGSPSITVNFAAL